MRFNHIFVIGSLTLLLAACGIDTTGLSPESSKTPKGNTASSVIITEYGDFQCPACKAAHDQINTPLMTNFGTKIAFEFKQFPLSNIHEYAREAAQASECAADQGKFWEFVDMNYANQANLNSAAIREWGTSLGLDSPLFDRCIRSGIKGKVVAADQSEGEKLGVTGTPSYFINGQAIASDLTVISNAIEAALTKGSSMPL